MMDARRRRRTVTATTVIAALAMLGAGCTGDDGIELLVDDGTDQDVALQTAMDNAYGSSSRMLESAAFGGLALEVEYFEPLRKGEWVAPEHCTFSTRVSINDQLRSAGFDGPRRDDDRESGEGVLVGTVPTVIAGAPSSPVPGTAPDDVAPTTVVQEPGASTPDPVDPVDPGDRIDPDDPSTTAPDDSTATTAQPEVIEPVTTAPDPALDPEATATTLASSDESYVTGENGVGAGAPDVFDPGSFEPRPAVAAVAVVFGHRQVVELSSDHPAVLDGRDLQAQPLDGWNLLQITLDPDAELGESVLATLRRIHEDGTETTEQLEIPVGADELALLNDDWRFDLSKVDGSCDVPDGSIDNVPTGPDTDIFGSPVGDAPELPEPGASPADPAAAADEALRSLRALYDLNDIYAKSKRDHVENPEDWDIMRRQLIENDVVAPYMSNLDPEFRSSVFVSPTEVHVLYRVGPSYQWEIGRVLLIDGRWRVAAGTVCRDLSAAGYRCPGTVNDPPPGPLG